jgi:hypothetical protein
LIIPPCPSTTAKQNAKYIKKREKYYTRFLQIVSKSEELKTSQFLVDFISETDPAAFTKACKEIEKAKFGKSIEDFITFAGQAKVQMATASSSFCSQMNSYADLYH